MAFLAVLATAGITAPAPAEDGGWRQVFFTTPGAGSGSNGRDPESAFIRLIGRSRKTFVGAFYELSSEKIANALIGAAGRGVSVKLVTDDSRADNPQMDRLREAKIPIVTDDRRPLMHNKFAVADDEIVWTGSYNLTDNCAHRNNNNAIMIRSRELAAIYRMEFEEMFTQHVFGNREEPGVFAGLRNRYYVKIGETNINVHFSPENSVERIIIGRIKKAKKSIQFMLFSFTSDAIGEAMIRKHKSGVAVTGIMERRGAKSSSSEYLKLTLEGIPVRLDRNRGAMHHKVMIIDRRLVITGSYNYSKNADKHNDENIIILDDEAIAGEYLREFERLNR